MKINNREINSLNPPYIVAEISGNHGGDIDMAILMMGMAMGVDADAVKFQAYTPDTLTMNSNNPDFIIKDGPWKGRTLYELYQKAHTPFEWFPTLFEVAKRHGQTVFASVFDKSSVDMLEKLDCPAYKIASMEIVDTNLIKYAADTGKPMIISTGMASSTEILGAVLNTRAGSALLHCVSGYPTSIENANLPQMMHLKKHYGGDHPIGISDHTLGSEIPVAATVLGVQIIEKHLCKSRSDKIEDADFSLEPEEFRDMVKSVKGIWKAMQPSDSPEQESSRQLRRSLYVVKDIKRGEKFTEQNVRSIRPGYGMPPNQLRNVLGKKAVEYIPAGTKLMEWHI